tara:strand:+ start:10645 stop:11361 length:717 start_codon:yes stop_codon:yes gene_type:complete
MISRELAINLGITLVFSIGLFVYFNSKVNKVENKINAVFEIIQQHNNNNMEYMSPSNEQQNMGNFMQINEVLEEKNDLVEISEDEHGDSEEESDDSEEESDDDSDEESNDNETEKVTQNEEEKKVSLSDDNEDIDLNIETVEAKDEKDNIEQVTIEPPSTINISELLAKKSDEQKKKVDENDDLSDVGDFDDEDHEKTDKPLAKWTVKELQDYAATKKLKKYKSLTKPKLIELIENAE